MEASLSQQSSNKPIECSFCLNPSAQVKILLKTAFLRIRKLLVKQKQWGELQQHNGVQSPAGIHRLIRVLFQRHQFELRYSKGCCHERLRSHLCQKLKCKTEQLQLAIEEFCDKLARRNYQLELVAQQVKNIQNSVQQLQDFKQVSTNTRKHSNSSQEEEPLPATSHLVKLEQGLVGSTGVNVVVGCGNGNQAIPFYNIIYYGTPYYQ